MFVFQAHKYPIYVGNESHKALEQHLTKADYSKIFVIVDSNTHRWCLPYFLAQFSVIFPFEIIEIQAGEASKNIEICSQVWQVLSDLGCDRKSAIVNLGGGVVTDLGGFVASTYQRGIDFINVPTTLLSMVDASIGGKTGIDLGVLKNQIGVVATPKLIVIDTQYLSTLSTEELCSGMAEMFKHGLIHSEPYWEQMKQLHNMHLNDLDELIFKSIEIKNSIVEQDPTEKGLRKVLNFGHTLGHAIESEAMQNEASEPLLHGHAIAIGCILEAYISHRITGFPINKVIEIKEVLLKYFRKETFSPTKISKILELLKFDKKNSHGNVNFVLLKKIGYPVIDITVDNDIIFDAFNFYAIN